MNKLLRTWWGIFRARRSSRVAPLDVAKLALRVRPTDIDILRHMNNGVYLSIADIGRFDLLVRAGIWEVFQQRGWYPVVTNTTISYRKSLNLWQRYILESRIVGMDAISVFVEQRFTVDGEIYARMLIRGRFLKRTGGTVSVTEIAEAVGMDAEALAVPEWIERWLADVSLPSTKQPAPSEW